MTELTGLFICITIACIIICLLITYNKHFPKKKPMDPSKDIEAEQETSCDKLEKHLAVVTHEEYTKDLEEWNKRFDTTVTGNIEKEYENL